MGCCQIKGSLQRSCKEKGPVPRCMRPGKCVLNEGVVEEHAKKRIGMPVAGDLLRWFVSLA